MDRLVTILCQMDLPKGRIKPNLDACWLLRNIGVRNMEHPLFREAVDLLVKLEPNANRCNPWE